MRLPWGVDNILTYGEDSDFSDRLHEANAVIVFDPKARLLHLRAPRGGERAAEWGGGSDGNWRVIAGVLYYKLANRPPFEAWEQCHPPPLAHQARSHIGRLRGFCRAS